jgi:CRP/FNR family transcriptional regulator
MKVHNGSMIRKECFGCLSRSQNHFCNLPDETLRAFSNHRVTHAYPKGNTLFIEGQPVAGVYLLCAGRVKLSTYSEEGRSLIVRIAEPGEVLGLSACIAGIAYEATAQAVSDCHVNFVGKNEFVDLLARDSNAALNAIRELSHIYHKAHSLICSLGLSGSASDKLAKLFLDWCSKFGESRSGVRITINYTHEELAEMIGTSRETVTRMMKMFRDRGLIKSDRSHLVIPDPKKLRASIGSRVRMD